MSLLFQLSIGVCPAVLLFVILTIISVSKKRPDRAINIAMLVVFSVTATALLVAGITTPESEEKQAQARSSGVNMQLSYAVAKEGDYSLALDVLYSGEGSSAHQAECAAWIHAAKGDALTAKALFVKANMLSPVENYSKVIAGCDAALADPEKQEALIKMACAHFDEVVEKQEVLTAGQVLVGSQQLYDRYLVSDQLDRAQVEQLLEDLEEACEEVSGLKQNETIRTCKIKLLALDNDYEAIAKSVSEESGFDEIAIAAELYINDLVESETFSGSYGKRYASAAKAVATQLKKVKGTLSRSELTEYKDVELLIEVLEMAKEEPAISHLYADLAMYAGNEQSPDRSKAYMQLARLSYADGNEEAAQQHISAALNTVGISDDENFSTPMINIVDSITDKDNIGKVKDIAQYAQDVTNNSSDYIVVKSISQYQVSTDDRPSQIGRAHV